MPHISYREVSMIFYVPPCSGRELRSGQTESATDRKMR
jgi:hypothetical protein